MNIPRVSPPPAIRSTVASTCCGVLRQLSLPNTPAGHVSLRALGPRSQPPRGVPAGGLLVLPSTPLAAGRATSSQTPRATGGLTWGLLMGLYLGLSGAGRRRWRRRRAGLPRYEDRNDSAAARPVDRPQQDQPDTRPATGGEEGSPLGDASVRAVAVLLGTMALSCRPRFPPPRPFPWHARPPTTLQNPRIGPTRPS